MMNGWQISFKVIWKRSTMGFGNVIQWFAYQEKGVTKTMVGFDALFISITLPDPQSGKAIIIRDTTSDGVFNITLPKSTGLFNPLMYRKVSEQRVSEQFNNIDELISGLNLNPQTGHVV